MIEAISTLTPELDRALTAELSGAAGAAAGVPGAAAANAASAAAPQGVGGPSFADAIRESLTSAMEVVQTGESMSIAAARGEASLHETVHAVIKAELTVQAVTSIRDQAVRAYQDLVRMPI